MADQAEALRRRVEQYQQQSKTRVVGVLSGKGGVGKSIFSVNFALALNRLGKKTLLIDLDIGMGNVDILLNIYASHHFADMIDKELSIDAIIVEHPSGLSVISGGSGLIDLFKLDDEKFDYFLTQFTQLKRQYDLIIFDLPAGFSAETLRFLSAVHEVILVTTTEPTALADAYAVIKMMTIHQLDIPIYCVVNRYDTIQEARSTWSSLENTAKRFLGKSLTLLGGLPRDHAVVNAVKKQMPFLTGDPKSKISLSIHQLARKYLGQESIDDGRSLDSFIDRLKSLFRSRG
ncbi:MAG: MinD/ParA family protein [Tuberibacillus sp.]